MKPSYFLAAVLAVTMGASAAGAQGVTRKVPEGAFIAQSVSVPSGFETIYVSGKVSTAVDMSAPASSTARFGGNTQAQTKLVFDRIEHALAEEGLGLGDIVMMRVYLVGDPALGGAMDFDGMMAAYKERFGTPTQPNKPARATVQVAGLVGGPGVLVEIEVQAVRKPKA